MQQKTMQRMTTVMKTNYMEISLGNDWYDYFNVEDHYHILDGFYL